MINRNILIVGSFLVYFFVWFFNYGFMGTDEYWVGMVKYLPAQGSEFLNIIQSDDVKSPMQIIPLFYVAKLALSLGIESPYYQYRFVQGFFNLILWLVSILAILKYDKILSRKNYLLFIFTFHFGVAALVTRTMYEALSFPWLFLFCIYLLAYDLEKQKKDLLVAVLAFCVAFAFRPQVGLCALALPIICLFNKKYLDFLWSGLLGALVFVLLGLVDLFWYPEIHFSLKKSFLYNVQYGDQYANAPWFFFLPLIFVFMFGPWFIKHFPRQVILELKERRSVIFSLLLFLLLHSMFANKFERFLIPAFAMLLVLLEPLLNEVFVAWRVYKWRIVSLLFVNFSIWFVASFSAAQKSIIDFVTFIDQNRKIEKVENFAVGVDWYPTVLGSHFPSMISKNAVGLAQESYALIQDFQKTDFELLNPRCTIEKSFHVNLIDHLAYKLNPEKNKRRSPLILYSCSK